MIPHSRPTLGKEEEKAVIDALRSKNIAAGETTKKLERSLAAYIGMKYGIAVSSGTAALHLSLISLGAGAGDEVIIPAYTCAALLNAVNYVGAKPVIADIDRDTYNITYESVKKNITKRTRAVIVPHMFGCPVKDMGRILKLGVPVIEDCAQSIGAKTGGKLTGGFGEISVFSFYATKMITTGQGGMVLTNDRNIAGSIRDMMEYDEKEDYKIRYNYKITDLQSAMGIAQLKKLNEFIKRRRSIAAIYDKAFSGLDLKLPAFLGGRIYFRYIIETSNGAQGCIKKLEENGIKCRRPVFKPLHRYLGVNGFCAAEEAWARSISLPIYPSLTGAEITKIINAVKKVFR